MTSTKHRSSSTSQPPLGLVNPDPPSLDSSPVPQDWAQGAQTSIYLAPSPNIDGVTGEFFVNSKPSAVSQPYHAFPAPDGSRGSPKDTSLVEFVFARTTRESVGHRRTRHRHGSGP